MAFRHAYVDTGCFTILFPRLAWADELGVELFGTDPSGESLFLKHPEGLPYWRGELELTIGSEDAPQLTWRAECAFAEIPSITIPLFGIRNALEHFRTTLDIFEESIEFLPNTSFQGQHSQQS